MHSAKYVTSIQDNPTYFEAPAPALLTIVPFFALEILYVHSYNTMYVCTEGVLIHQTSPEVFPILAFP